MSTISSICGKSQRFLWSFAKTPAKIVRFIRKATKLTFCGCSIEGQRSQLRTLRGQVGSGRFGSVYRGRRVADGHLVALKKVRSNLWGRWIFTAIRVFMFSSLARRHLPCTLAVKSTARSESERWTKGFQSRSSGNCKPWISYSPRVCYGFTSWFHPWNGQRCL